MCLTSCKRSDRHPSYWDFVSFHEDERAYYCTGSFFPEVVGRMNTDKHKKKQRYRHQQLPMQEQQQQQQQLRQQIGSFTGCRGVTSMEVEESIYGDAEAGGLTKNKSKR